MHYPNKRGRHKLHYFCFFFRDISENVAAIDVTSTISLEDHLEGREIPVSAGRDTGLLVATIVLSVLLFILIVAIAVWFFLRW